MVEIFIITDSSNLNEDDIISLSSEHWFNDNIINYYFNYFRDNVQIGFHSLYVNRVSISKIVKARCMKSVINEYKIGDYGDRRNLK